MEPLPAGRVPLPSILLIIAAVKVQVKFYKIDIDNEAVQQAVIENSGAYKRGCCSMALGHGAVAVVCWACSQACLCACTSLPTRPARSPSPLRSGGGAHLHWLPGAGARDRLQRRRQGAGRALMACRPCHSSCWHCLACLPSTQHAVGEH